MDIPSPGARPASPGVLAALARSCSLLCPWPGHADAVLGPLLSQVLGPAQHGTPMAASRRAPAPMAGFAGALPLSCRSDAGEIWSASRPDCG